MKVEVTIGIPVYKSVDRTILSALSQTFIDIEILIIDDCGNDGTIDKVSVWQSTHPRGKIIRILQNDKNRGVSYCRNRIIDESLGRFLYFLDSDDIIEPTTIQILYETLNGYNAQIAYGSYEIVANDIEKKVQKFEKPLLYIDGSYKLAAYVFKNIDIFHVSVCNILMDIDFVKATCIRFIDVSYWEDMAFSTELAIKVNRAAMIPNITYHYIHHLDSLSHQEKREGCLRDEIINNVAVLDYLKNKLLIMADYEFLPYLIYNLELNSFYLICNILKKANRIVPMLSSAELRNILRIPLTLKDIWNLKRKRLPNIFFWLISVMPLVFFLPTIKLFGTIKKVF